MKIDPCKIADVKLVRPVKNEDARGFFSEVYKQDTFLQAGLPIDWVQDNHSRSRQRGVLRGLHFQSPPYAQAKLVRVTRGAIFDVAVDLRRSSPTYGQHVAVELSDANWLQLYVPAGFAHGYCTLTEETEVQYKVNALYAPSHDLGVLWSDRTLGIDWPIEPDAVILSEKDKAHPGFQELPSYFE